MGDDMPGSTSDVADLPDHRWPAAALLSRMGQLLWRWGPALAGIWLLGDIVQSILRWVAVIVGQQNRMAGMAVMTLVILVRVVTVVAMFRVVVPAQPAPVAAQGAEPVRQQRFYRAVALVLVPFFLYYAAWGLLGDTMRNYAMLSMAMDPLGTYGPILDVKPGQAAIVWTVGAWLVRRFAKTMQKRQPEAAIWPFLIVAAEAMWIFVGLYMLNVWKDEIYGFFAGALPVLAQGSGLIGVAHAQAATAALPVPSDRPSLPFFQSVLSALLFGVLPLVWFNLGAIIRGRDVETLDERLDRHVKPVTQRWQALPKFVRDFAGNFIDGIITRWRAVANAVQMMLGTSIVLLLMVIVGFRLLDWLAGWGTWASMQIIGPLPFDWARATEALLTLVWGTPRSPGNGLLPEVLKVCLISAALDLARPAMRQVTSPALSPKAA